MDAGRVAGVRSFNRTITQRVGALNEEYLARGRPLGASRVLWEIGRAEATHDPCVLDSISILDTSAGSFAGSSGKA